MPSSKSSITVPLTLALVYTQTGDLVGLRQALEQLDRQAEEIRTLVPIVAGLRSMYELQRGRVREALQLAEIGVKELPPKSSVVWALMVIAYAQVLLALGRVEEARLVIARATRQIASADRSYLFYSGLELAQVSIDIHEERFDAARRRLDTLIEEHEPHASPLTLFNLHEAYARLAMAANESSLLETHLGRLEEWARTSENPALIAKFKRVEGEVRRPPERDSASRNLSLQNRNDAVRRLLETQEGPERILAALKLAIERSLALGGYLYVGSPPRFRLVAQFPQSEPPPLDLGGRLTQMAERAQRAGDFFSTIEAGSAVVEGLSRTETLNGYAQKLHAELLILPHSSSSIVVGALVLRFATARFEPIGFDLLETIGQTLYRMFDYRALTQV